MLESIVTSVNDVVWSIPLIILILGAGIYFSVRMKFPQLRLIKEMFRLLGDNKGKGTDEGVSGLRAFIMTAAGRVGVGNIAGMATAIALGGPGAIFWLWVVALFGTAIALIESTLAQAYKITVNGEFRGGPAYYIEKGIGKKWYAKAFALVTILAPGILMPGVQSYNITSSLNQAFGWNTLIIAIVLAVVVGICIFGGVKRISAVAEKVSPFMACAYLLVSFIIIGANISKVPGVFMMIVQSAFSVQPIFGALAGAALSKGVMRGVFANEAGQGTSAIMAGSADVSHPVKQGLASCLSVYAGTILVCTTSAFMILLTGCYNVVGPAGGFLFEGMPGKEYGVAYVHGAIDTIFPGFGAPFIAVSILLFAFIALLAYYYYAESNLVYVFHETKAWMKSNKPFLYVFRGIFILAAFQGCLQAVSVVWTMGDIGCGLMTWLNVIAVLILSNQGLAIFKDYERQKKLGLEPVFDPDLLGIQNAGSVWRDRLAEYKVAQKADAEEKGIAA